MHPEESQWALYAGGELGWWKRWRLSAHLRECAQCRGQLEEFRRWRRWLRGNDELPAGLNWGRLAAEMRANIRVGLAAGECVGAAAEPVRWRPAAFALPVLAVVLAGFLLQVWHPPLRRPATAAGVVLAATSTGVELRQQGAALAVLHPRSEQSSRMAAGDAVRTGYLDSDTGYVTISHVYAE